MRRAVVEKMRYVDGRGPLSTLCVHFAHVLWQLSDRTKRGSTTRNNEPLSFFSRLNVFESFLFKVVVVTGAVLLSAVINGNQSKPLLDERAPRLLLLYSNWSAGPTTWPTWTDISRDLYHGTVDIALSDHLRAPRNPVKLFRWGEHWGSCSKIPLMFAALKCYCNTCNTPLTCFYASKRNVSSESLW